MYLFIGDYLQLIQPELLSQLTGGDDTIRARCEEIAQAEVTSYLTQRYDVEWEFSETLQYRITPTYKVWTQLYLDANPYSATAAYPLDELVLFQGKVFLCTTAIITPEPFNPAKWQFLGNHYQLFYAKLPKPLYNPTTQYSVGAEVFFNNKTYTASQSSINRQPDENPLIWGAGVAYEVPAGTLPNNATFYTQGDKRSQQLVAYTVDIALYHIHKRIAPRNIPQLRIDCYDMAISWLKSAGGQDNAITAAIPKRVPKSGQRVRWGVTRNNNSY